jgi:hypothetical protein
MVDENFAPMVRLDLKTASREAFADTVRSFNEQAAAQPKAPLPFTHDGWHDITPAMAEVGLARNAGNREPVLSQVKKNALDMEANNWKPTGETIVFNQEGDLNDGQHRLWAGYLSLKTFRSFVVGSAPVEKNLFAYYDRGKLRSAADALHTAGMNGLGKVIARAIAELAIRYDHDALGPVKSVRFRPINQPEVLDYAQTHDAFVRATHLMFGNYPDAVRVIGSKQAAAFFAWLVVRAYDEAVLERFCKPLGSGANLTEDDPILDVREKLMRRPRMARRCRLARGSPCSTRRSTCRSAGRSLGARGVERWRLCRFPSMSRSRRSSRPSRRRLDSSLSPRLRAAFGPPRFLALLSEKAMNIQRYDLHPFCIAFRRANGREKTEIIDNMKACGYDTAQPITLFEAWFLTVARGRTPRMKLASNRRSQLLPATKTKPASSSFAATRHGT